MGSKIDAKIVLLGREYAGKTCLVERYLHGKAPGSTPYQNTIGAAFGAKKVSVAGRAITLGIWDTAGSERYKAMSRIYYRGAKGAVVCFDLTDSASFGVAREWIDELKSCEEACKVYLCGTKKDLISGDKARAVSHSDIQALADDVRAKAFETSSVTGESVGKFYIVQSFMAYICLIQCMFTLKLAKYYNVIILMIL
ncbi:uncharacterized protein TRIADDRAFT_28357 [Trichoplax adhaerens]|uniref:Ras-related protein Rab-24 n=1 Tax=Trichoplax adhaerens TaxID=10228 RepID=B3S2W3_TRIAD|nr:hypothetical protein TRIADDRAFT_28357 [Trichoplax adhaerens]EDV22860.1 hypothetical protein TRIADDRAFT_28357 [Trichoplax adhaerens]|eukprot:XP_002114726.1 hypothetical protein TRIADDRAFT_28357 [Trichoplax adhaerens]